MMGFAADDLKLREYIPKTAVDDIFDKAREAAVGIAADDDDLTGLVNQLPHILKPVFHHTDARRLVPAVKTAATGTDQSVVGEDCPSLVFMLNLLPVCRFQIVYDKIHEKPPFQ